MRRGRCLAALTLVAISAVVAMCVYPTEHDADVFVTIDSLTLDTLSRTPTSVGPLVVIQGAEGDVHATAWHRQSGGPSPVPNVSFRWSVADTTLARIDATTGHLVAIKAGITQVRVRSEEHTSELQSLAYLVCRLLLEKKKRITG